MSAHPIGMLGVERDPEVAGIAHRIDVHVDVEAVLELRRRGVVVGLEQIAHPELGLVARRGIGLGEEGR
jgi:hypothetical protein